MAGLWPSTNIKFGKPGGAVWQSLQQPHVESLRAANLSRRGTVRAKLAGCAPQLLLTALRCRSLPHSGQPDPDPLKRTLGAVIQV